MQKARKLAQLIPRNVNVITNPPECQVSYVSRRSSLDKSDIDVIPEKTRADVSSSEIRSVQL